MIVNHEDHEGHEEVYEKSGTLNSNLALYVIELLTFYFCLNSKEQVLISS